MKSSKTVISTAIALLLLVIVCGYPITNRPLQSIDTISVTRASQQARCLGVTSYTVQTGDTIQSIAEGVGLRPRTIVEANSVVENEFDLLYIGQQLTIPPVEGNYHIAAEGDTLNSIAEKYNVAAETICKCNDFKPSNCRVVKGMRIVVPIDKEPCKHDEVLEPFRYEGLVLESARGTGQFQWPVLGRITQGYWYGHREIDIGAPFGAEVLASDGGFVSFAAWNDIGWGDLIVIDHGNGFTTYYSQLSNQYVQRGQVVEQGEVIGAVGSTGFSTGPHLGFRVHYRGIPQNPRAYLP